MYRFATALAAAIVLVFTLVGGAPTDSDAQSGSATPPRHSFDGRIVRR